MRSSGRHLLSAISLGLSIVVLSANVPTFATTTAAAVGSPTPPSTGSGVDISFPQCSAKSHVEIPPNDPFAIIGVNGGVASNSNPCLQGEYNSALLLSGATEQPHAAVYVNTGNPALAASWWPSGNMTEAGTAVSNPDGSCASLAGAPCAYVYGYSMAQADYRRVRKTLQRMPTMWWLDVETTNTWQTDLSANEASLTGMVDYFHSKDLELGIYSTPHQWNLIAGVTPPTSHLAGLLSWLAGGSAIGAAADCEGSPLTPFGRVAMVQYVTNLDNDYSCHLFRSASAAISPRSIAFVGSELTAVSGSWAAGGVSYSFQWNRNGNPIPGATARTYLATSADVGCTVWVTITGMKPGYSTTTRTSRGITVFAPLR